MAKKEKTSEQIYNGNVKKVKIIKAMTPFIFWGLLAMGIVCLVLAIRGTFGNLAELIALLDNEKYNGSELQNNYNYLITKYGEWVIGNGGAGFTIRFVDVKQVAFSGFVLFIFLMSVLLITSAFVLGKWVLPRLANQIEQENQNMVNRTILRQQDEKKE